MPINLVRADPHRRKLEPVSEHAALRDDMEGTLDIDPRGARTVEQETMILRPDLDVARHRLVVQSQVSGQAAEEDMDQLLLDLRQQDLVLVAMDTDPAVGPLVRFPEGPVMLKAQRVDIPRSVKPARLGNAQPVGTAVALHQVQQGNLQGEGKLALQLDIGSHSPEKEASRERQQVELPRKVCGSNRSGKGCERTKRKQVLHRTGRLISVPEERPGPLWEGSIPPKGKGRRFALREDSKSHTPKIGEFPYRHTMHRVQKPPDEPDPLLSGNFHARPGKKTPPECSSRALLASAEESPAEAALVVLRPRQGQRRQCDIALLSQGPHLLRQFGGPIRVALQDVLRDPIGRTAFCQMDKSVDDMPGHRLHPGLQFEELFILRYVPAPRIVLGEQVAIRTAIGSSPQPWRRHELGVGCNGVRSLSTKPWRTRKQPPPPWRMHGTSR